MNGMVDEGIGGRTRRQISSLLGRVESKFLLVNCILRPSCTLISFVANEHGRLLKYICDRNVVQCLRLIRELSTVDKGRQGAVAVVSISSLLLFCLLFLNGFECHLDSCVQLHALLHDHLLSVHTY